jgi:hypothetical protein
MKHTLDGEEEAMTMDRRTFLKAGGAALGVAALPGRARGQAAPSAIRIGYAISLSGPFAPGAQSTSWSQYKLWAKDVNDAIHLKYEKKVPVELIEYDDRSQPDEVIKLVERLILQDKVDLVLPPWGTHMNLAVAPIINKHEYPVIFFTATALRIRDLAKRWPYASSRWLSPTARRRRSARCWPRSRAGQDQGAGGGGPRGRADRRRAQLFSRPARRTASRWCSARAIRWACPTCRR